MIWTIEKLIAFKEHFTLTDAQIAKGLGVSNHTVWRIRNGESPIEQVNHRMTGYMEAVREGKIREMETMINYFKAF